MKKNYLVFAGSTYYPSGGFGDFRGGYSSFEDADKAARSVYDSDWKEITLYDQETGTHKTWSWSYFGEKWKDQQ